MSKSNYLENEILDHVLGGSDYTRPATVYVRLYLQSSAVGEAGGGTEVSGTDYAPVAVTNNATNWPAASGGAKSNGTVIDFGTVGSGGWGQVGSFGVWDASTSGNLLYYGSLGTPKTLDAGDTCTFPIGSLDITED
jgi:hypothetical protein